MRISSPAFVNFGSIPEHYSCEGDRINPPLEIFDVPEEARSLVLIMDDPDAQGGTFDHWLIWNIDPNSQNIPENSLPPGAQVGKNSAGIKGYTPPCPPEGEHHYRFKLFALNKSLELPEGASRSELEESIKGSVVDVAELVGTYAR